MNIVPFVLYIEFLYGSYCMNLFLGGKDGFGTCLCALASRQ